ncbi:MAG: hypothetical protein HRU15_19620 [Planctomycetes bacterium]|nr:hypothetical protein [Planctomycetota bacterium]
MAKEGFGLHSFGIWHAFQGYWRGVAKDSELGKKYRLIKNMAKNKPWEENDIALSLSMLHPDDVLRFYFDFYRYLKSQGVDMVKVDNQSALEKFSHGKTGRVSTMQSFQQAFQGAGQHFFAGNILHCMSNGSDVAFNMLSSNTWRNSDDYFPQQGIAAQQLHVAVNAYCNTWTSTFCTPDWDMFQSHGPNAEFHAIARSISGGPVYVCDKPHKQNFSILKKMALKDGTALRCQQPALLSDDCVMVNTLKENKALKLYNSNGSIGVLALLHCQQADTEIHATWRISDVPSLNGKSFACYAHCSESLTIITQRSEKHSFTLQRAGSEIIHLSPIESGIAALGLLDKYNGSAAITYNKQQGDKYICKLRAGSKKIGFYCAKRPKSVFVNSKKVKYTYVNKTGLLIVAASEKSSCRVVIKL